MLSIRKLWKGPKPLHVDNHSNKMWLILVGGLLCRNALLLCPWLVLISGKNGCTKSARHVKQQINRITSSFFCYYKIWQVLTTCDQSTSKTAAMTEDTENLYPSLCSFCTKSNVSPPLLLLSVIKRSVSQQCFCSINSRSISACFCISQSINCNTGCTGNQSR